MKQKPKVSILILNYNEKKYLKGILDSAFNINFDKPYEVFLIDNNSTDGSVDFVKKNFSKVKVIKSKENIGTPAFNLALPFCLGEYIIFLGCDSKIEKDSVKILVNILDKNEEIGGIYPKLVGFNGEFVDFSFTFSRTLYFFPIHGTMPRLKNALGPGIVRRSDLRKTGDYIYDPDYFYGYEDIDLCLRIRLLGKIVIYEPKSVFYHAGAVCFSKRFKTSYRVFIGERNSFITFFKICSPVTLLLFLPYNLFIRCILILKDILTFNINSAFARLKAIFWVIIHPYVVYRKRKQTQSFREVSDKFVFSIANEYHFISNFFKNMIKKESFNIYEFDKRRRSKNETCNSIF